MIFEIVALMYINDPCSYIELFIIIFYTIIWYFSIVESQKIDILFNKEQKKVQDWRLCCTAANCTILRILKITEIYIKSTLH